MMATHPDEHGLIYEPDHEGKAAALLMWQELGKARIEAFVRALGKGTQLLENTIWAVFVGTTTLQGSEGVNLDRWGFLVGEQRGGLTNEQYRRFILLRMRVNSEFPDEDLLWEVVTDAVSPSVVTVTPLPPAGIQVQVDGIEFLSEVLRVHTAALIRDLRPLGVIVPVVESIPGYFGFDGDPDAQGFSSLASPSSGGILSRLIYSGRGPR
jgi:hypothetical protein